MVRIPYQELNLLNCESNAGKITEPGMCELIEFLDEHGFTVESSCSGHGIRDMYVVFAEGVGADLAMRLCKDITAMGGVFGLANVETFVDTVDGEGVCRVKLSIPYHLFVKTGMPREIVWQMLYLYNGEIVRVLGRLSKTA